LRSLQEIQPDFVEEAKDLSWAVEPRKEEEELCDQMYLVLSIHTTIT